MNTSTQTKIDAGHHALDALKNPPLKMLIDHHANDSRLFADRGSEPRWEPQPSHNGVPIHVDPRQFGGVNAKKAEVYAPDVNPKLKQFTTDTLKRAGRDGGGASKPDMRSDRVRDSKMPNPKSTTYELIYEQSDDEGASYKSVPHMTSMARRREDDANQPYGITGLRPEMGATPDENEMNFGGHCQSAVEEMDAAITTDDNPEAREAHLSRALEHIDAACKTHRQMKRVKKA